MENKLFLHRQFFLECLLIYLVRKYLVYLYLADLAVYTYHSYFVVFR